MAYSPIEQGRLLGNSALEKIAKAKGVSEAAIAIRLVAPSKQRDCYPQSGPY